MTLDQFASFGEIIAAVAVVASLIYVAKQLGQNTEMMRANASEQRVQRNADLSLRLADSQEFTDLWRKGISDFQSLGETEKIRLIFFNQVALLHWHNMFKLRMQNLLSEEDWKELTWLIEHLGLRQDLLAAWEMFKDSFDESFQEFMDTKFENAKPLP